MNGQVIAKELVAVARELTAGRKQLRLKDAVTGGTIQIEVLEDGKELPIEVGITVSPANVGATLYLNREELAKMVSFLR
jgi:hypothetical protein